MRRFFKGILVLIAALLGLLVVLLLVILGLRWYNANQYPFISQTPDTSAQSGYATSPQIQRIEGDKMIADEGYEVLALYFCAQRQPPCRTRGLISPRGRACRAS